jgi:hypothetical protein
VLELGRVPWQVCGGSVLSDGRRSGSGALGSPAGGQERRQIDQTNASGEPRQDVGEILAWIDAREAARAEDRVRDRSAFSTGIRARKEKVLTIMPSFA